MGLDLKTLCNREKTNLESFSSKVVAIDAYNAIYQFLAIIRGPEGLPLTDSRGKITSHMSGLFYRNVNFLSLGIKPVYVFDGKPPSLKSAEIERRKQIKKDATIKFEPELIDLQKTLAELALTREQLVDVGILIGTDFNPAGFERIGPKTAPKAIKEHGKLEEIPQIQEKLEEIDYKQIRQIFLQPKVASVKDIKFGEIDFQGIINYLSTERSFSRERVEASINRLKKAIEKKNHTLEQWFGN